MKHSLLTKHDSNVLATSLIASIALLLVVPVKLQGAESKLSVIKRAPATEAFRQKALFYLSQAQSNSLKIESTTELARFKVDLGKALWQIGEIQKARKTFDEAQTLALSLMPKPPGDDPGPRWESEDLLEHLIRGQLAIGDLRQAKRALAHIRRS